MVRCSIIDVICCLQVSISRPVPRGLPIVSLHELQQCPSWPIEGPILLTHPRCCANIVPWREVACEEQISRDAPVPSLVVAVCSCKSSEKLGGVYASHVCKFQVELELLPDVVLLIPLVVLPDFAYLAELESVLHILCVALLLNLEAFKIKIHGEQPEWLARALHLN